MTSRNAKQLNRSRKKLVFNLTAAKSIMAIGMQSTGALIPKMERPVKGSLMRSRTRIGEDATKMRELEEDLLRICVRTWGDLLIHVFDRGYSSGPCLLLLQSRRVQFVIHPKKMQSLFTKKSQHRGLGTRSIAHRVICATQTGVELSWDIRWALVWHPSYDYQLYTIILRLRKKIWSLVTNKRPMRAKQAWNIVCLYRRECQIKTSFRSHSR